MYLLRYGADPIILLCGLMRLRFPFTWEVLGLTAMYSATLPCFQYEERNTTLI